MAILSHVALNVKDYLFIKKDANIAWNADMKNAGDGPDRTQYLSMKYYYYTGGTC